MINIWIEENDGDRLLEIPGREEDLLEDKTVYLQFWSNKSGREHGLIFEFEVTPLELVKALRMAGWIE